MPKVILTAVCMLTVSAAHLVPVSTPATPVAEAGSCYEIYGEIRELGGPGWAHIVVVQNDCDYWLQCTVWTNVDPQPPAMISVGPDMSEKAQITRNSEEEEFKAYGTCRRK